VFVDTATATAGSDRWTQMPSDLRPPRKDLERILSYIGVDYGGDLGDWTVYRTRNGKPVFFPIAPPKPPGSPLQIAQRQRFKTALSNWKSLSQAVKAQWEQTTNICSICATGMNLWISLSLNPNTAQVAAQLARANAKTGYHLTAPAYVP